MNAAVILVEYGDFGCPRCEVAYSLIKRIKQWLGNHLCFVYRHFPQSGEYAWQAAEMAEFAGKHKQFWQLHDYLFEHQQELTADRSTLAEIVDSRLHMGQFKQSWMHHRYKRQVEEDVVSGVLSGVWQTPTFFINSQQYTGSWEFADLLEAIEIAGFEQEEQQLLMTIDKRL
jgi:protein-disulfide isomerase